MMMVMSHSVSLLLSQLQGKSFPLQFHFNTSQFGADYFMSLIAADIAIDADTLRKAKQQHDPAALYRIGNAYYHQKRDYATALKYFEMAAFRNNAKAQDKAGSMYCWGNGVEADYSKAVQWYLLAADQGYSKAQYHVGWMYQYGKGLVQDNKKAYVWFLKSAVQGYKHAQYSLGCFHRYGLDIPVNYSLSFQWFLKAGSQQHRVAQYWMGHMYYNGEGVDLDKQASLEWFFKAANNGSWEALNHCNSLNKEGYHLLPHPNKYAIKSNINCTDTETQKDQVICALVKSVVNVNTEKKVLRQKNLDLVAQINQQMQIFKTVQNQFKKKHQEKEIMESRNIQLELKLQEMQEIVKGIQSGLDNQKEKHIRC